MSLPDNIRYCKQLTSVDCSSNRLERSIELFYLKKKEIKSFIDLDYAKD
jgi:hypothetical protein